MEEGIFRFNPNFNPGSGGGKKRQSESIWNESGAETLFSTNSIPNFLYTITGMQLSVWPEMEITSIGQAIDF